jgi:Flp pilus assembly protein TadG
MKSSQRIPGPRTSAEPNDAGPRPSRAGRRRGLARREDGAAAVEFAIVATLFFMLVFGIIDFGFAFHSWNNAANAAREGARTAAVNSDVNVVKARVMAAAQTLDPTKLTVTVVCKPEVGGTFSTTNCSSLAAGGTVRVIVDYIYSMVTPLGSFVPGIGSTLNLHSQSESRYEGA